MTGVVNHYDPHFRTLISSYGELNKNYWTLVDYFGVPIYDRTQTLNAGFKYAILSPIPKSGPSLSFSDICDARAEEIIKHARELNVAIDVFWSGGIDSTLALVALLKASRPEDVERIVVWLSNSSINEYPDFYEKHILGKLKVKLLHKEFESVFGREAVVVTGELGDQVFGSMKLFDKREFGDVRDMPWKDFLWMDVGRLTFVLRERHLFRGFIDYLSEQVEKSEVPIKSAFDLLWWINFSMKYQNVQMRLISREVDENFWSEYSRLYHFFDTDDFQRWSIENHDKKMRETAQSYKYVAKDYIYDFTKDAEYRDEKLKVPSLNRLVSVDTAYNQRHCCFVVKAKDDNLEMISYGRTSSNPKLFRDKYANIYSWVFE